MNEMTIYIKNKTLNEIILRNVYILDIVESLPVLSSNLINYKQDSILIFDCMSAYINIYSAVTGELKSLKELNKDLFFENYYEQIEYQIIEEMEL